jgi:hypothetical protein
MPHTFKRGERVFICQKGLPEFGEWCRIVGPAQRMGDEPWYRYRVEGERKTAGLIVHESWVNREVPASSGAAKALGYV